MSENKDYIQLPPLKKDTPSDVVAFMWEYMKVPENSREKVKNLLKDANEYFKDSYDRYHSIMDEQDPIKRMTGIKINENDSNEE